MRWQQNRPVMVAGVLLIVVAWSVYWTGSKPAAPATSTAPRGRSTRNIVVDQSALLTAERLVRAPVTADERPFAEDALRIADNEMDLAFAQAVRRIANQPRATSDTAKEADARLQEVPPHARR